MITVNPAKLKRISGPEAVALTRKNLRSAAWSALVGVFVCAGHAYGLHGGWQYFMLAAAGWNVLNHLLLARRYSREIQLLERGEEVVVVTDVPRALTHTPWIVDVFIVIKMRVRPLALAMGI